MNWKTIILILFALIIPVCLANSLPYWIADMPDGTYQIWTKINISAGGSVCLIVKKEPGYSPNGDAVFEFFDDFDGNSLNTSKWECGSNPTINNSCVILNDNWIAGKIGFEMGKYAIVEKARRSSTASWSPPVAGWTDKTGFYDGDYYNTYAMGYMDNNNYYLQDSYAIHYIKSTYYGLAAHKQYVDIGTNWQIFSCYVNSTTVIGKELTNNIVLTCNNTLIKSDTIYPVILNAKPNNDLVDWVFVRKYAAQEPTVSVEKISDTALAVKITNPNNYTLTNFQVAIPGDGIISSKNDSLFIGMLPVAQIDYYKSLEGYTLTVSGNLGNVSLYLGSALLYSGILTSDHPFQTTFSYDVSAYPLDIVYHDYRNVSVPYQLSPITQGTFTLNLVPVGNYTNETFYPMIITVAGKSYWISNYSNIPMNVSVSTYENSPILITSSLGQEISVPAMNQKVPIYFTTSWSSIKASTTSGHVLEFETQNGYIVGYGQIINIKIPTGLTLTPYLDDFKLTPFTVSQDLNLFYSPTDLLPQIYVYQTINGDILISIKSLQPHNFTALFYQNNTIVKNISLLPGTFTYPNENYTKIVIYVDGKNYTTMELYPTNPLKDWDSLDFPEKVLLSMFLLSIVGIIYLVSGITMVLAAGIVIPILILLPLPTSLIGFISAFLLLSALFYLYKRRV